MPKALASQPYFTLFVYEPERDLWSPQFGDFSAEVVLEETAYEYRPNHPKKHLKVIRHRYDCSALSIAYDLGTKGKTTLGVIIKL